jgi:hypothetical protein
MGVNGTASTYDTTTHTITMDADSTSISGRYCAPFKKLTIGKMYTLSFSIRGTEGKTVKCGWDKKNLTITLTNAFKRYEVSLTVTSEKEPIVFYSRPTTNGGLAAGEHMQFSDVQIELGNVATEYEPYSGQTVELTHTLPGIPVTSGGNYTDSDGQQWICDEVDMERGVYVQRLEQVTLNGSEDWVLSQTDYGDVAYYYRRVPYAILNNGDACGAIISDMFKESYDSNTIEHIRMHGSSNQLMLFITKSRLDEVSVAGLKSWLTTNNVNVVLRRATPTETPLSETEIAAYRAMHSNYPNTTVLNDAGAHMVVKYAADTKLYIDNKIAALVGGV